MKTDELIRALAADPRPNSAPLPQLIAGALALGATAATALFFWQVKLRADFASAMGDPAFVLKFLVTLSLAGAAGGLLWNAIRPGASERAWLWALLGAPALLLAGILYEFATLDPSLWGSRLVGRNSAFCLRTIPWLSAPILIALLLAMRKGAPTRPVLAGAAAGLLAGGLGAALYAAHCTDDSPLFVMTWYGLSIAVVTAIGAAVGARWLRW